MYLNIIFLHLFGLFWELGFGKYLGSQGISVLTTYITGVCCFLSYLNLFELLYLGGSSYIIKISPWVLSGLLEFHWCFFCDSLTSVMLVVVTTISFLVHLYSSEYLKEDPHIARFMGFLSLFTFFMIALITGNNFLQLFMGWEGVGLCSFFLINFWFTRLQANKAAIKAMVVNRVGDFFLFLGILILYDETYSVEFTSIFAFSEEFLSEGVYFYKLGHFFLFLGAMGKSAQLGLHSWLPDAMEGPTPVSALIHAATMVTAGVFLIARCSFIFENFREVRDFIAVVGALTSFFAASTGLFQNDLKRVIAYSTCSQLGYMVFSCGLSGYSAGLFHLSNHAFFKALLFLSAGSVIHTMGDEQDLRRFGGLRLFLPISYVSFVIGSLALAGFPFLSGFYSKDCILEIAYTNRSSQGVFTFVLGSLSAFFTAFYSYRLLLLTFFAKPLGYRQFYLIAVESPNTMLFVLAVLGFLSVFSGYLSKDFFIGPGSNFWGNALYYNFSNKNLIDDREFLVPLYVKLLPTLFAFIGAALAISVFSQNPRLIMISFKRNNSFVGGIYMFLNKKWLFDKLFNQHLFVQRCLNFGLNVALKSVDKGFIEYFGPRKLSVCIPKLLILNKKVQSGRLYDYAISFFLGFFVLGFFMSGFSGSQNVFIPIVIPCCFVFYSFGSKTKYP
jgi:proton-translocating NADH-quinone oxidoreductase chain L